MSAVRQKFHLSSCADFRNRLCFFLNHPTPFILGMPLLLAWLVLWILLTSAIMGLIYALDPANRGEDGQ